MTRNELELAIQRQLTSQVFHALKEACVSLPEMLKLAIMDCFVYGEAGNENANILRQAQLYLNHDGFFKFEVDTLAGIG